MVFFFTVGVVDITADPELTPLGQNATFTCPSGANFIVQIPGSGRNYDTSVFDEREELATQGIIDMSGESPDAVLQVLATADNNGTNVTCRIFDFFTSASEFSETLTLFVIGM